MRFSELNQGDRFILAEFSSQDHGRIIYLKIPLLHRIVSTLDKEIQYPKNQVNIGTGGAGFFSDDTEVIAVG